MNKDNELMFRVQKGDKQAFELLVNEHREKSIYFANSIINDMGYAEDIVQECFAKIYINRILYKPTFTFKTYLYSLIRNQCIDKIRVNKHYCHIPLDQISNIPNGVKIDEILFQKEEMKELFNMINSLSDDYRTALYLYAVDDLSYKEIAIIMKKTISQVKILIFRARKKLKQLKEGADNNEITTGISERSVD